MKAKHYFLIAAVGMFTLAAGSAMAFHGGGVAHCDGCHSMHNSADNPIGFDRDGNPTGAVENSQLLKGSDASSTCLNCHKRNGGYGVLSTDGSNINTGGDFFFLTNGYTKTVHGHENHYLGDQAGHNVVAQDYGLVADGNYTQGPGGNYNAGNLGCTSCHDPHGQKQGGTLNSQLPIAASGSYGETDADYAPDAMVGNYRLLGDSNYQNFGNDAPVAVANGSGGQIVRYGSGMSEWCANCHGDFIGTTTKHVTGAALGAMNGQTAVYNAYVATGDYSGSQATSWDPLVPFETGSTDAHSLAPTQDASGNDVWSTAGPQAGANVMCLTCHRAHASGHNNAGRWDFAGSELLAESASLEDQVAGLIPPTAVIYYGDNAEIDVVAKYGDYQRSLCNKCHVKD